VENLTIISATVNKVLSIKFGGRNPLILSGLRVSFLVHLEANPALSY